MGSETRIAPREPTQACNIRYQGGHGCRSYASIPRGLRCEPWSGRAEDIGMNGDNQLHLGVMCRQSVEEADGLSCMCARCAPDSGSAPCSCRRLGGRHAMPSPWKQVQGLLLRSRANFRPIDGQWSMNGARCGSEGARCVSQVVHNGKGSRTRPRGELLRRSIIAYRPAMRLARVANKKKPGGRARQPFESREYW